MYWCWLTSKGSHHIPSRFTKAIFQTKADASFRGVQVPAVKVVAPGENRAVTDCCENKPVLQMCLTRQLVRDTK